MSNYLLLFFIVVESIANEEHFSTAISLGREAQNWGVLQRQHMVSLVNPVAAVGALGELTPGGALMKGFQEESLSRMYENLCLKTCA